MKTDAEIFANDKIKLIDKLKESFINLNFDGVAILKQKGCSTVIWNRDEEIQHNENNALENLKFNHVSIVINHSPTYEELKAIKEVFFYDEDTVIQFFPSEREYVNIHEKCYHLWELVRSKQ